MINLLVNKVSSFLFKNNIIDEEQLPVINYGLQYLLTTILMIATLMIIGLVFSQMLQMIGLSIGFFFMRNTIGGYHTKSETTCFIMTISMLTGDLILINLISYLGPLLLTLIIISTWVLMIFVKPVDHHNRKFTEEEFRLFRKKSIRNLFIITLLSGISILVFNSLGMLFAISLFVGVLTAMVAVLVVINKNRRMCKDEIKINE